MRTLGQVNADLVKLFNDNATTPDPDLATKVAALQDEIRQIRNAPKSAEVLAAEVIVKTRLQDMSYQAMDLISKSIGVKRPYEVERDLKDHSRLMEDLAVVGNRHIDLVQGTFDINERRATRRVGMWKQSGYND